MILKKSLKTYLNVFPLAFSTAKTLSHSLAYFPYRFSGGIDHVFDNETHLKLRSFINFLDKSLENGFTFAYNNLLDGLQSKDLDFLNQNFENRFFSKIESFPSELDSNNLELQLYDHKNDEIEVFFSEMSMILGVRLQRDSNPKGLFKNNLKPDRMVKFMLYTPNKSFFLAASQMTDIRPLLQIPVVFRSRKKLFLKRKNEEVSKGKIGEEECHKVVFECEGANLAQTSLFGEMVKFAGRGIRKEHEMGDIFHKFFFTKESEWKITDIDNFMEGNEF